VSAYGQTLQVKSDHIEAHQGLGLALYQLNRFDEALASFRHALELMPGSVDAQQALGLVLLKKSDAAAAADTFRRALADSPDLALSWNGLGQALSSLGQFDEASNCFRRALEFNPNKVSYYRNLAICGKQAVNAEQIQRLNNIASQPDLPVDDRITADFALGKLLDEVDRFDEAFPRYAEANLLIKQQRSAAGENFDADALRRQIDHLIETFTTRFFVDRKGWGEVSELPVFIVGMPRSGTTLVEQIAASHTQVFGAGEPKDILAISATLGVADGKTNAHIWHPDSVKYLARAHLQHLQALGGKASRVIDKFPDNITDLGLIALLFPSARVIFCHRDARDNCLSCYFQWFTDGGHTWCYDLANCGRRYLEIDRLANHWHTALPLRMLDIQYEQMVDDLEGQSRRLIDFLGLPWDPACLEFHKTQRSVMTASVWQVRQPIYNSSVGRWRHYERHLGPLLEVLENHSNTLAKSPAGM
jgi:tetratricopeptide (TPR) repeat protein